MRGLAAAGALPAIPSTIRRRLLPVVTATATIIRIVTRRDSSGRQDRRDHESLESRHFEFGVCDDFSG